ncbi:hypothetical protein A8924_0364 [Saccharopolyspora erythraea NRRL 2338]|uniref:DUF6049 family protein n=1 Tax=Saccharopolyspora erythraea TaxID=1836 RepID=A0ABN1D9S0_SACER|nr:DUF6049 family protein [Saccharopolyspora erythraea]PFG93136.1 hypothetical protein A8924_0364 [Saccharopolyspora erythraea NRRL 2338]
MRFVLAAVIAVLLLGAVPVPQATAQNDDQHARLEVSKITPSVVGAGAPPEVTVTGTLTNTSSRAIHDVEARIQRGDPTTSEAAAQRAVRDGSRTVAEQNFTSITGSIAPGQRVPFELRIPFTGPNSLQVTSPGVYPLLVNVNGRPAGGARARIDEAHFLLPVLAAPGAAPAAPPKPAPTTMLVPIVDYPRLARGPVPGSRPVLMDDLLSESLAPGGRLYELVRAVGETAGPGSRLGNALCFAIDPDLLATVRAMQTGYLVRQPSGGTVEGIGAGTARLWLSKLKEATAGRCVIPLPYSDVDVVALGRAGLPDVIRGALDTSSRQLVQETLGVEPRKDVLWPVEGTIDEPAAGQVAAQAPDGPGITTALLRPEAISGPTPARVRGSGLAALSIDPLVASALDPLRDTTRETTELSPQTGDGVVAAQNALGALAFRANTASAPGGSVLVAPPRRWNVSGGDVRALLTGMEQLAAAGVVQPTSLPEPDASKLPEVDLSYPVDAAGREIPRRVLNELAAQNYRVGDLFRAADREPAVNVQEADVTNPMRNALLRGASSAWRGNPDAARYWVNAGRRALDLEFSRVRLEEPNGKLTLGGESDNYIPLTVANDLPVTVSVVFRIPRTPGLETKDLGVLRIPAQGRRSFFLPTTVHRSGQFTLDISLATPSGTELGPPKRLRLESGAYGPVILVLTIIAASLLIVLSAFRVYRRFRNRVRRVAAANAAAAEQPDAGPQATEQPETGSPGTEQTEIGQTSNGQTGTESQTTPLTTTESDRSPG